jgi:hypothetical protein
MCRAGQRSVSNFAQQVQTFVDKTKAKASLATRKIAIEMHSRIVERSPVGNPELWAVNATAVSYNAQVSEFNAALRNDPANLNRAGRLKRGKKLHDGMDVKGSAGYVGGRFKGNWVVSIGAPQEVSVDRIDPSGSATLAAGRAAVAAFVPGQTIYLQNNLPYGPRLEYEGWSDQAPAGMVRITVAEFQDIVKQVGVEIRNTSK